MCLRAWGPIMNFVGNGYGTSVQRTSQPFPDPPVFRMASVAECDLQLQCALRLGG